MFLLINNDHSQENLMTIIIIKIKTYKLLYFYEIYWLIQKNR